MRASGILLPIFSLPSKTGIGCFSKEARNFIDMMHEADQRFWQILPINPCGKGNSPYQPISCFAGDPIYIDPETLLLKGLLSNHDISDLTSQCGAADEEHVNYEVIRPLRMKLLRLAFNNFVPDDAFDEFKENNSGWLRDYARYAEQKFKSDAEFEMWMQYEFFSEWQAILSYAHSKNVEIIGDLPIYASLESADCEANPEIFMLRSDGSPSFVGGCPPDAFSKDGQIWDNPIYDWDLMKRNGYLWWINRLRHSFMMYDVIRLDHARGFESYYAIPVDDPNPSSGHWIKGPGTDFFNKIKEVFANPRIIAEDLGFLTPEVRKMIRETGFPGMCVIQFAFDFRPFNPYLPKNISTNSVVYTGTHDNDTTLGWLRSLNYRTKNYVCDILRHSNGWIGANDIMNDTEILKAIIRASFFCNADTCITPMQDFLALGSNCRMNIPGTPSNNWVWRMRKDDFDYSLSRRISKLTDESCRSNSSSNKTKAIHDSKG